MNMKLSEADAQALREARQAKSFDEALNLTPASVLERLLAQPGSDEAHDFFGEDLFPEGIPDAPTPEELAQLEAEVEQELAITGARRNVKLVR